VDANCYNSYDCFAYDRSHRHYSLVPKNYDICLRHVGSESMHRINVPIYVRIPLSDCTRLCNGSHLWGESQQDKLRSAGDFLKREGIISVSDER